MPVSNSFLDYVLDQLSGCGSVTSRRMFGGAGLYAGDRFFAIIMDDVLYLKVDDTTRKRYERARTRPFKPYPDRSGTMQYYEVPLGVLESAADLTAWAREAIAVAKQSAAPSKRAKRR